MIPLIILAIENDDDREFMISIYTKLYPMMKAVAFQVVKDDDIAEDIVHDAIADLIRKLDLIRDFEQERLKSYINRTVFHHSVNSYHKRRREEERTYFNFEDEFAETIPDISSSPVEIFEMRDEYEKLGEIMKQLPERERELLYMKYNMQYSDETIGKIMGIKKDSVRQYLTRARRIAREYLTKEGAVVE